MMLAEAIAAGRPRVVAALAGYARDLDAAEDGFADAVEALLRLPASAIPANIPGWLYITGRRRLIDAARRQQRGDRIAAALALIEDDADMAAEVLAFPDPIPDDRLRLIFATCHPAIAPDMRVALALRLLFGVEMPRLAAALLTNTATLYQRTGRAKAKIREAGIGFDVPERRHWPERLDGVLTTLELVYALAYQDAAAATDADLAPEVARLAGLMVELLPDEPEVLAMAALIAFGESRRTARVSADGIMVPLSEQDPARWDRAQVEAGCALLDRAASAERPGPRQLIAAIHMTHAHRIHVGDVDWTSIVALYDALARHRPTPPVAIARALAIAKASTPAAGLVALDELDADRLASFRPYACAKAQLLSECGDRDGARLWWQTALTLDPPPAERRWIEQRLVSEGAMCITDIDH
jgi:RNA polymerase sigma-70 factor, ECF subfamily